MMAPGIAKRLSADAEIGRSLFQRAMQAAPIHETHMSSPFVAAMLIGLLHGIEPWHGWPIAAVWARQRKNIPFQGIFAGVVLSFFHFVSSIVVAVVFILIARKYPLQETTAFRYAAALLLFGLAALNLRRARLHHHHGDKKQLASLRELAAFAFVLGFVHEEEFAILALCGSGASCLLLMVVYASAVTLAILVLTMAAIQALERVEQRVSWIEHQLPVIMAVFLVLLGVLSLTGWL